MKGPEDGIPNNEESNGGLGLNVRSPGFAQMVASQVEGIRDRAEMTYKAYEQAKIDAIIDTTKELYGKYEGNEQARDLGIRTSEHLSSLLHRFQEREKYLQAILNEMHEDYAQIAMEIRGSDSRINAVDSSDPLDNLITESSMKEQSELSSNIRRSIKKAMGSLFEIKREHEAEISKLKLLLQFQNNGNNNSNNGGVNNCNGELMEHQPDKQFTDAGTSFTESQLDKGEIPYSPNINKRSRHTRKSSNIEQKCTTSIDSPVIPLCNRDTSENSEDSDNERLKRQRGKRKRHMTAVLDTEVLDIGDKVPLILEADPAQQNCSNIIQGDKSTVLNYDNSEDYQSNEQVAGAGLGCNLMYTDRHPYLVSHVPNDNNRFHRRETPACSLSYDYGKKHGHTGYGEVCAGNGMDTFGQVGEENATNDSKGNGEGTGALTPVLAGAVDAMFSQCGSVYARTFLATLMRSKQKLIDVAAFVTQHELDDLFAEKVHMPHRSRRDSVLGREEAIQAVVRKYKKIAHRLVDFLALSSTSPLGYIDEDTRENVPGTGVSYTSTGDGYSTKGSTAIDESGERLRANRLYVELSDSCKSFNRSETKDSDVSPTHAACSNDSMANRKELNTADIIIQEDENEFVRINLDDFPLRSPLSTARDDGPSSLGRKTMEIDLLNSRPSVVLNKNENGEGSNLDINEAAPDDFVYYGKNKAMVISLRRNSKSDKTTLGEGDTQRTERKSVSTKGDNKISARGQEGDVPNPKSPSNTVINISKSPRTDQAHNQTTGSNIPVLSPSARAKEGDTGKCDTKPNSRRQVSISDEQSGAFDTISIRPRTAITPNSAEGERENIDEAFLTEKINKIVPDIQKTKEIVSLVKSVISARSMELARERRETLDKLANILDSKIMRQIIQMIMVDDSRGTITKADFEYFLNVINDVIHPSGSQLSVSGVFASKGNVISPLLEQGSDIFKIMGNSQEKGMESNRNMGKISGSSSKDGRCGGNTRTAELSRSLIDGDDFNLAGWGETGPLAHDVIKPGKVLKSPAKQGEKGFNQGQHSPHRDLQYPLDTQGGEDGQEKWVIPSLSKGSAEGDVGAKKKGSFIKMDSDEATDGQSAAQLHITNQVLLKDYRNRTSVTLLDGSDISNSPNVSHGLDNNECVGRREPIDASKLHISRNFQLEGSGGLVILPSGHSNNLMIVSGNEDVNYGPKLMGDDLDVGSTGKHSTGKAHKGTSGKVDRSLTSLNVNKKFFDGRTFDSKVPDHEPSFQSQTCSAHLYGSKFSLGRSQASDLVLKSLPDLKTGQKKSRTNRDFQRAKQSFKVQRQNKSTSWLDTSRGYQTLEPVKSHSDVHEKGLNIVEMSPFDIMEKEKKTFIRLKKPARSASFLKPVYADKKDDVFKISYISSNCGGGFNVRDTSVDRVDPTSQFPKYASKSAKLHFEPVNQRDTMETSIRVNKPGMASPFSIRDAKQNKTT